MGVVLSGAGSSTGREGRDLSSESIGEAVLLPVVGVLWGGFARFLRRAMSVSWQLMQNIPCEVLAYFRFSIFRLQFRHLKQPAQNACSPVRIARSSILFPQAVQL